MARAAEGPEVRQVVAARAVDPVAVDVVDVERGLGRAADDTAVTVALQGLRPDGAPAVGVVAPARGGRAARVLAALAQLGGVAVAAAFDRGYVGTPVVRANARHEEA